MTKMHSKWIAALFTILSASSAFAADANQPAAAGPTDPQIAAIVVAANSVDIDAGKFAQGKAKNSEVKKFAKQMVTAV